MIKTDRYVQTEAAGMLYRLIPVTEEIIRCVIGKEEIKGNDSLIIEKKEYPAGQMMRIIPYAPCNIPYQTTAGRKPCFPTD